LRLGEKGSAMSPLKSMTGFGRADLSSDIGSFAVEIKAVNHRFLDARIHLPRELSSLEIPLLKTLKSRLGRGKVEVSVRWTPSGHAVARMRFNRELLREYQAELALRAVPLRPEDAVPFEYVLSLPGVAEKDAPQVDQEEILKLADDALVQALDILVAEREREGVVLERELLLRLDNMASMRTQIEEQSGEVVEAFRQRLAKKAAEWAEATSLQVEGGRLETEVMMFAERSDITEELTRLAAHLEAYREAMAADDDAPRGKPLEFLTQELLRETNTIASKARDTSILSTVLAMKHEIEKIREQVMNVE